MKMFNVHEKSSGFLVTVTDDGRVPYNNAPPAPQPPYSNTREVALSTFDDVIEYMREEMGFDKSAPMQAMSAGSQLSACTMVEDDYDWRANDRRATALNHAAALGYKEGGTPDIVLHAAQQYEEYLKNGLSEKEDRTFEDKLCDRLREYESNTKPSPEK